MTPSEVREAIFHAHKISLLACYWTAGDTRSLAGYNTAGLSRYSSEHIPTALFCDPAAALAAVPSSTAGRNPMPDPDTLAFWFRRWGLRKNRSTIVYDFGRGLYAARAWWILRWAGVDNVRILDGGLTAWDDAGYPVLAGPGNQQPESNVTPNPGQLPLATMEDVREFDGLLIDAREPARFGGRRELLDLKAGHIPGAVNVPSRDMINPDGTYRSPDEIRTLLEHAGVTGDQEMIVYSGSGNHSAQLLVAMHLAGFPTPAHYVGGWSQWSATSRNPVAVAESQNA